MMNELRGCVQGPRSLERAVDHGTGMQARTHHGLPERSMASHGSLSTVRMCPIRGLTYRVWSLVRLSRSNKQSTWLSHSGRTALLAPYALERHLRLRVVQPCCLRMVIRTYMSSSLATSTKTKAGGSVSSSRALPDCGTADVPLLTWQIRISSAS